MSKNDLTLAELKQLISTITFFQLGARTKELKTIKLKLKNQLKEMESKRQVIELSDGTKITLPESNTEPLERMTREEFCKRQKENS